MKPSPDEIKSGIACYHREQKILLRLIRMSGGLTASRFDKLFRDREYRRGFRIHPIERGAFILGMGRNGFNGWAWYLDLLQHMGEIGLINTMRNESNEIVYVIPGGKNEKEKKCVKRK